MWNKVTPLSRVTYTCSTIINVKHNSVTNYESVMSNASAKSMTTV